MHNNNSIVISIASYRDSELFPTILSCISNSKFPNNLHFVIALQDSFDFSNDLKSLHPNIHVIYIPLSLSKGPCFARSKIQSYILSNLSHISFYLQIDSHMRFISHWDSLLLSIFSSLPTPKSILSCYPNAYIPPNDLSKGYLYTLTTKSNPSGIHTLKQDKTITQSYPIPGLYLAAGFIFSPLSFISQVPYDPFLYFEGEEITLSARAYSFGWSIFHPYTDILFHFYSRPTSPKHWSDSSSWSSLNSSSHLRIKALFEPYWDNYSKSSYPSQIELYPFILGSIPLPSYFLS